MLRTAWFLWQLVLSLGAWVCVNTGVPLFVASMGNGGIVWLYTGLGCAYGFWVTTVATVLYLKAKQKTTVT